MAEKDKQQNQRIRGFGYLYPRGSIWWIRYSVRGKECRESSGSGREADALKLLKQRWQQVGRGRFIGPSEDRVMMDSVFDALELDYKNNERRSYVTLKGRLHHLRAAFGNFRAVDVTEEWIERYKNTRLQEKTRRGKRPVSRATINREIAMLRKAFNLALDQKRISVAPKVSLFSENSARQGFLEPTAFEAIHNHLPGYLQDFSRFAYITGWRRGELQTLTWADVNRDAKLITLRSEHSKNGEPRLLPLAGELEKLIERRWLARPVKRPDGSTTLAEFVFHHSGHQIVDIRKAWVTAAKAADMPGILFHDLRRSAVRNLDRAGVGQAVAMKITGHKTDSVYRRYRIVSESDLRMALERTQAVTSENQTDKPTVTSISATKEATL